MTGSASGEPSCGHRNPNEAFDEAVARERADRCAETAMLSVATGLRNQTRSPVERAPPCSAAAKKRRRRGANPRPRGRFSLAGGELSAHKRASATATRVATGATCRADGSNILLVVVMVVVLGLQEGAGEQAP